MSEAQGTLLSSAEELQAHLKCHPVVARLLWNRGLRDRAELDAFLKPELTGLPDPMTLAGMREGVECLADAIDAGAQITIYGDYDVDGTCGATLLVEFLRKIGVEPAVYQPDRFKEGYGLHLAAVEKLAEQGAEVLVTVDCGITAIDQVHRARELGMDVIILDHHKLAEKLPEATAVVNPQRPDDKSGMQNLCGTGVAFFFIVALRAELRARGFFEGKTEPNLKSFLDLVAVATVADMVDVRGVNRILLTHGLQVLKSSPRIGLKALLDAAEIKQPTAMHLGFVIGPRINAAGRLVHARAAFELLTTNDAKVATEMAINLERINTERRAAQDSVVTEAREAALKVLADPKWEKLKSEIPAAAHGPWPRALVLWNRHWHEGVLGIAASKIVEEFGRPVFILAAKEGAAEPTLKGSIRSMPKIDILSQIVPEDVSKHLLNYGGHAHAGGVTLLESKIEEFTESLNRHMAVTTAADDFVRTRHFDTTVELRELSPQLATELDKIGPFGQKFPEPVFKIEGAKAADVKVMKEKHLKIRFETKGLPAPDAVWFNALGDDHTQLDSLRAGTPTSFWISPSWNEWQGTRKLQLRISHAE